MNSMRPLCCFALLSCLTVPTFSGDWAPTPKLDAYFDALARHELANGSVAISEKGVVRYQRSVGFARMEGSAPVVATAKTRYRVGSVSKLFTATLVMQLAENGKVSLDDTVAHYSHTLPNASAISIRQLLQHRSGLPNYSDDAEFEAWRTKPRSEQTMLATIAGSGSRFKPGERVEYSNSNYLVLGYLLEKAYSAPYADILQSQLAIKLGLAQTYYLNSDVNRDESVSYSFTPGGWVAQAFTDPSIHGGAGGVISTPVEMVRVVDALFAGKLVKPSSLASMQRQDGGSGMGLWPYTVAQHTGVGHGGRMEGFRACVYHFPDAGVTIAYATNASILSMDEIVDETLALVFEPKRKPSTFDRIPVSKARQSEIAGTWRSVKGIPANTPFRQFATPDQPLELILKVTQEGLIGTLNGTDFPLVAVGEHEYMVEGIRYFLRAYPQRDELVVRGPEWAYFFRREK